MQYKVWVQVERVDNTGDECENVTEPVDVSVSQTLPEALAMVEKITTFANLLKG